MPLASTVTSSISPVFDQAMTQVSWLRPDFALSVGDVIEGYSDDRALIEKQWNDA